MHPVYSHAILSRIDIFRELAPVASAHHERLDGKGYPLGLKGDEICVETRILTTADIFDALTADRPYRAAMPISKALTIMSQMVGTQLDADCFTALNQSMGRIGEVLAA
jgi:HD-GYP domain-containing protein (c-di-GMP phosphodiesterase class II)